MLISSIASRMAPSKVSRERFETAVTSMHAIGIQSEIVTPVLENLLQLYDYNWEHIEADNFRVLTDAIFDDPEPKVQLIIPLFSF